MPPSYVLHSPYFYDMTSKWFRGYAVGHILSTDHPWQAGCLPSPHPDVPPVHFDTDLLDDHSALLRLRNLAFLRELRTRFM